MNPQKLKKKIHMTMYLNEMKGKFDDERISKL